MPNPQTPAYQRIKDSILANIHSGKWTAGVAIPTEMELTEIFAVSRMTVNRALKELTNEGVLERRQGSGTFVAQKQFSHTFVEIRNIAEDIQRAGNHYRALILDKKTISFKNLTKEIADIFQDRPSAVHFVAIVHYADDRPLQLEERWVSADLLPDFMEEDFEKINTSDYLIKKMPLESGHYQILAQCADKNHADALGIKKGAALLILARTTLSQGKVITFVRMSHAGEHYQFSGNL